MLKFLHKDESKVDLIKSRNKFFIFLMLATFVPAIPNQINMGMSLKTMFFMDIFLVVPIFIFLFTIFKNKYHVPAMYLGVLGVTIGFANSSVDTNLYAGFFVSVFIITMYLDKSALIFSFILNMICVNLVHPKYVHTKNPDWDFFIISTFLTLSYVFCFVIISSTEKYRKSALIEKEETLKMSLVTSELLAKSTEKEKKLVFFNDELNTNLNYSNEVSNELLGSFKEITKGSEEQNMHINSILDSLKINNSNIENLSKEARKVYDSSKYTESITNDFREEMKNYIENILKVQQTVILTSDTIQDLNDKNNNIVNVLNTMREITNQTNLLALNASIEAARAGIHGKGFNVVATEVKKLAEYSKNSSDLIEEILDEIKNKTINAKENIEKSIEILDNNVEAIKKSDNMISEIHKNAGELKNSSKITDNIVVNISESSNEIINQMGKINSISNDFTASIEEISSSFNSQNESMRKIIENFNDNLMENKKEEN